MNQAGQLGPVAAGVFAELGKIEEGSMSGSPSDDAVALDEPVAFKGFVEELYLELNPDVAASVNAGGFTSARSHWLLHGQMEASAGCRSSIRYQAPAQPATDEHPELQSQVEKFDAMGYLSLYPDVSKHSTGNASDARDHWQRHGRFEGRVGPGLPRRALRHVSLLELYKKPFGINLFGPFAATSGLGTASRSIAKAVKKTGIPFQPWAFDMSGGEIRIATHHEGRLPTYRVNMILANADQVGRLFGAYPASHFNDAFNIGVWQWELANFRSDWYYAFDGLDEIWTNSQFQFDAINSIAPVPVTKVHLPVAPGPDRHDPDRARFGIPADAYAFMMSFDVGSTSVRKNPFAAIEAFGRVKQSFPQAHLVLKYHSPRNEPGFTRRLNDALRNIPGVSLLPETLTSDEMEVLRASCDCLLSPHRSEGFGLNIAEFMSLGKPVIATGYSGNTDFFDESVGFPIDYSLTAVQGAVGPYRTGCVWAEPSLSSLAEQMALVISDAGEARRRAEAGRARVAAMLSVISVAGTINARLAALGLAQELPAFTRQLGRGDAIIQAVSLTQHATPSAPVEQFAQRPVMSILLPVYNVPGHFLEECVAAVRRQTYPFWELCICNDGSTAPDTLQVLQALRGSNPKIRIVDQANGGIASATNHALEIASGEFVVFLDNDDLIIDTALEDVVRVISSMDEIDVLYSDEDKIDESGVKIDHFFKPDWSPEHLESVMYVLHMLVIRKALVLGLGGLRQEFDGAQDYDLMLRCSRETNRIHHLAKVLYHWRAIPGSAAAVVDAKPRALENGVLALNDHLHAKHGMAVHAENGLLPGTFRLRRKLEDVPVTLLILTGNQMVKSESGEMIALVDQFVDSILEKTSYPNYSIVVVDNGRLSEAQIKRFQGIGVRVENHVAQGRFNYAAKANFAIQSARTEQIVLLNDDMGIIRNDWLTALLELSVDPAIGAVGARLLHKDGSIQHVGVVLGVNGSAAHVYHCYPREFVGYNAFTHIIRNYSAVTAACLATRKSVCAQVGGFDERFAIDFNDIDFCLKLGEAGFRVAYTPFAELFHYEGASAQRTSQDPAEIQLFKELWNHKLDNDPFYNVNLTRSALDFSERQALS